MLHSSAMRGLGGTQNTFANESFMDELAAAAEADPLAFRRAHLANDQRALDLLAALREARRVASAAGGSERRPHGGATRADAGSRSCATRTPKRTSAASPT